VAGAAAWAEREADQRALEAQQAVLMVGARPFTPLSFVPLECPLILITSRDIAASIEVAADRVL
jgi:hypothetical protein